MSTKQQLIANGYEWRRGHIASFHHSVEFENGEPEKGNYVIVPKYLSTIKRVSQDKDGWRIVLNNSETYYQKDFPFGHGETLEEAWEMAEKLITLPLPVYQQTDSEFNQQFDNRYSIYCNDPYKYEEVNFELIAKLAQDLGAVNPTIARRVTANEQYSAYLTADKFTVIQDQLDQKDQHLIGNKMCGGNSTSYLIEVNDDNFYEGYPVLFWRKEDITSDKDCYGDVCFTKVEEVKSVSRLDQKIQNQETLNSLIDFYQKELEKTPQYKLLQSLKNALENLESKEVELLSEEDKKKLHEFDKLLYSIKGDRSDFLIDRGYKNKHGNETGHEYWVHCSIEVQWTESHWLRNPDFYPKNSVID